jgi:hypothetical protein
MAVYLNEAQAGCDRHLVGFPALRVCMGVVLQTRAWLYAMHFDDPGETRALAQGLLAFIRERGGNVANAEVLYGASNWASRYGGARNLKNAWKDDMREIADVLGFHGRARGFDTSIIPSTTGRYVEFHPDYAQHRCRIFYKAQDDSEFGSSVLAPAVALRQARGNVHTYKVHGGQAVDARGHVTLTTTSTAAGMAELDYALRLERFTI